ncbi:hypothetical protein F4776DRAFT_65022 [Hypoxylon sp. NC0597]|nr:hypothetical protein F4776DRAFT_65022 [Hypoxylon sp. NC0597]
MDHCSVIDPSRYFDIPPVSDVTGIGVLIGFIFPAYILLFIVVIYFIFIYDPTLNPYRGRGKRDRREISLKPNLFDQLVLRLIRANFISAIINNFFQAILRVSFRARRKLPSRSFSETWDDAFNKYVSGMADTQVITGLAILLGGYVARFTLSALHWKMIVYLAWFSCSTHLSTLVFLRNYLINKPFEKFCRLFSTFALLLCLTIAMIPTGHFYWDELVYLETEPTDSIVNAIDAPPSGNVTCYFNFDFKPEAYKAKYSMGMSIILLVLVFITKTFKLHQKILWFNIGFATHHMVVMVLRSASFFQRLFGTETLQGRIVSNMIVAAHMTVCVWIDLSASMASDVYWLIVSITWGTMKILDLRIILSHAENQEDTWSFGQLLPVLLLALPMVTLVEQFRKLVFQEIGELQDQGYSYVQTETPTNSSDDLRSPPNSDTDSTWILRPEDFDKYYKKSIWMCWVVSICLAHTFGMTTLILQPDTSLWDNRLGKYVAADTVSMTQVLIFWFVFVQGAVVHIAIFLLSFIEMKLPLVEINWKRRLIIHSAALLISAGLSTASAYTSSGIINSVTNTDIWSLEAQGASLFYLVGTLSLLGIAIAVWWFSVFLPQRFKSRGKQPDIAL